MLGKGGMGEVYKAQDIKLDQTVALKFLPEKLAKNEDALKRFVGEVKTARQVAHGAVIAEGCTAGIGRFAEQRKVTRILKKWPLVEIQASIGFQVIGRS